MLMEALNKFHSLDIHMFQNVKEYRRCVTYKMLTKITLPYSIITSNQIIVTLSLACFVAKVVNAQRCSEKNPTEMFQKVPKKVLEEKSLIITVTGYMPAIY